LAAVGDGGEEAVTGREVSAPAHDHDAQVLAVDVARGADDGAVVARGVELLDVSGDPDAGQGGLQRGRDLRALALGGGGDVGVEAGRLAALGQLRLRLVQVTGVVRARGVQVEGLVARQGRGRHGGGDVAAAARAATGGLQVDLVRGE